MKKILFVILFFIISYSALNATEFMVAVQQENGGNCFEVFFDEDIATPDMYRGLILELKYAKKEDVFIFHMNTNGGDMSSTVAICDAIRKTKAKTIADLYKAYSAGAYITLSCQKVCVNNYATMMIHRMSVNGAGKIVEIKNTSDFFCKWEEIFINENLFPFLTNSKYLQFINGTELWLDEDSILLNVDRIGKLEGQGKKK